MAHTHDPGDPLANRKHERFALLMAQGEMTAADCYRKAGLSAKGTKAETIHCNASKLATKVEPRIRHLRKAAQEHYKNNAGAVTLSMAEKLSFLARVVKCRGASLDEEKDGDLINGVEFTEHGRRLKLPDKLAALKLHNDLSVEGAEAGANKAIEIIVKKL